MKVKTPCPKLLFKVHIQNNVDYREFYKHNRKEL
jgi:hypothetical protein